MCLWGPVCFPIAEFIELGRNGKGLEATHRSELKHEPHGASSLLNAAVSPRYPCGVTLIPHLNSRDLRMGLALFTLSGEWELKAWRFAWGPMCTICKFNEINASPVEEGTSPLQDTKLAPVA